MDNRQFNVNGEGREMLQQALELVFEQQGERTTCVAYRVTPSHGMELYWYVPDGLKPGVQYDAWRVELETKYPAQRLPTGMTAAQVVELVWAWLNSPEAGVCVEWTDRYTPPEKISRVDGDGHSGFSEWDRSNIDMDGSIEIGWRVFCNDWGHVRGVHTGICAVKPAALWFGK